MRHLLYEALAFFFQAEDGIRDHCVTGVQTCALPISARSRRALKELTEEIGDQAIHVVADVSQQDDVRAIARVADEHFGSFDTWVNNAGTGLYGKLTEV